MSNYDINWEQYFLPDHWWRLEEASGAIAYDNGSHGNILPLTHYNTPTLNRLGKVGNCYEFTATSSEYLLTPNSVVSTATYTVCMWIRRNAAVGSWEDLFGTSNGCYSLLLAAPYGNTVGQYHLSLYSTTAITPSGGWYFICLRSEQGVGTSVFVNGIKENTSGSTENISGNISIAKHPVSTLEYFNGLIDDVRLYLKPLTDIEIKQLYNYTNNYRNQSIPILHKPTHDKYTKLYCTFDGDIYDESESGHDLHPVAAVALSDIIYHFGNGSAYFPDIAGESFKVRGKWQDWDFQGEDFTIDWWMRYDVVNETMDPFGNWRTANEGWVVQFHNDHRVSLDIYPSGGPSTRIQTSVNWTTRAINTWYHCAWVRNGSNWYFFIDGVQLGTTQVQAAAIQPATSDNWLAIGTHWHTETSYQTDQVMKGYLDNIRISKGIARWTSNFTPPSTPYEAKRHINTYRSKEDLVTKWPLHWWKLNEESGSTNAIDYGTSIAEGVNTGGAVAGHEGHRYQRGWYFANGVSTASLTTTITFDETAASGAYTWTAWCKKIKDHPGVGRPIVDTDDGGYDWSIYTTNNSSTDYTLKWVLFNGGSNVNGPAVELYRWCHVAAVFDCDNDEARLYLNGELVIDTTLGAGGASSIFRIGHQSNAIINDVQIYSGVLTLDEIYRIYKYGLPTNALGDYCAQYMPELLEKDIIKNVDKNRFSDAILPEKYRTVPENAYVITPGDL